VVSRQGLMKMKTVLCSLFQPHYETCGNAEADGVAEEPLSILFLKLRTHFSNTPILYGSDIIFNN
jgi:hypothetical protein